MYTCTYISLFSCMYIHIPKGPGRPPPKNLLKSIQATQALDKADANRDGVISKQEFFDGKQTKNPHNCLLLKSVSES